MALGSRLVNLHTAEGLELDDHCGPFQPRPFYDSMFMKNKRQDKMNTWYVSSGG